MRPHPEISTQAAEYRALRRRIETLVALGAMGWSALALAEPAALSAEAYRGLLALAPREAWLGAVFLAGAAQAGAVAVNHGRTWTLALRAATLAFGAAVLTIIAAGAWLSAPPAPAFVVYSAVAAGLWGLARRSAAEAFYRFGHG